MRERVPLGPGPVPSLGPGLRERGRTRGARRYQTQLQHVLQRRKRIVLPLMLRWRTQSGHKSHKERERERERERDSYQ
jgi:hypothetical protein